MSTPAPDLHDNEPILHAGPEPSDARLVVIALHGRGAGAEDMIGLAHELQLDDVAFLAPQAANRTWYPYSFLVPMERNEPWLSSAIARIAGLTAAIGERGIDASRVAIMGFSQGACLALEYAARHPRVYAAVAGLSGGLIGPPGTPRDYPGSLAGTRVFLGCSDVDQHVPIERVQESAAGMKGMGAAVDLRIYKGMGHTVNADEIEAVRALLR
jgi:predicted esterase